MIETYHVDVVCAQVLERALERRVYVLGAVSAVVALQHLVAQVAELRTGELGRDDDLVTAVARLHPFANPLLAFFGSC